jgi:hypothetical protein
VRQETLSGKQITEGLKHWSLPAGMEVRHIYSIVAILSIGQPYPGVSPQPALMNGTFSRPAAGL